MLHFAFNAYISLRLKHYTHLTQEERYQISSLLQAKTSPSEISRILGRHKSTISREIRRNKGKLGALFTLVDRTTRENKIKALPNRKAQQVSDICIAMLKGEHTLSITCDGREFAAHQSIANALDTDIYFAKPYHSWERGTNTKPKKKPKQQPILS